LTCRCPSSPFPSCCTPLKSIRSKPDVPLSKFNIAVGERRYPPLNAQQFEQRDHRGQLIQVRLPQLTFPLVPGVRLTVAASDAHTFPSLAADAAKLAQFTQVGIGQCCLNVKRPSAKAACRRPSNPPKTAPSPAAAL
jgi:hypothetical protein